MHTTLQAESTQAQKPEPPTIVLARGTRFLHSRVLNSQYQPQECVVTAVRQGVVYWRCADSKKAKDYFPVEQSSRYVKQLVSAAPPAPEHQQTSPA